MKKSFKILLFAVLGVIVVLFCLIMFVNVAGIPSYENEAEDLVKKTFPPLAKDLFPQGVRVIAVQGLPPTQVATGEAEDDLQQPVFTDFDQPSLLLLLVPNASRARIPDE